MTIPHWFIRYGLPAGFLLLATVVILLARPALHAEADRPALREPAAPAPAPHVARERPRVRSNRASAYSVRSGDTLGTIAERFGTTVDELLLLNPGVDPHALRVGQPLRVE
ncbi:MAG TPA: LysM domain-containing protein [Gaiellaceae bacterium]|nr:LysM domain-containing protein [Gaiellaceae bacterium]